jgi:hypothetical protein
MTQSVSTVPVMPGGHAVRVEDVPAPEVGERASRRTYTARYKLEILAEYERLDKAEKGALLRRELDQSAAPRARDVDKPGWALTDSVAAAAYGAPLVYRPGQVLDFYVPDLSVVRRAVPPPFSCRRPTAR